MIRPPLTSTLFPYTTLFRSCTSQSDDRCHRTKTGLPNAADYLRFPHEWNRAGTTCPGTDSEQSFLQPHALAVARSEEHTSELQSRENLVCRLLLEKKKDAGP